MRYKITTRTLGAGSDPFAWVSDDFLMNGITVDEAIDKGRAAARKKHPKGTIHLVYGAIPAPESAKPASNITRLPVRAKKGKVA